MAIVVIDYFTRTLSRRTNDRLFKDSMLVQNKEDALSNGERIEVRVVNYINSITTKFKAIHVGGTSHFDIELGSTTSSKKHKVEVKERRDYSFKDIEQFGSVIVDKSKLDNNGEFILISVFTCGTVVASIINSTCKVKEVISRKNNFSSEKVWKDCIFADYEVLGVLPNY